MDTVVTRFAPSPTGFMHVGGVRTALYAWLYARKHGGVFILRIEDTDKKREVEGSIEHIISSLKWLGIVWDQGPDIGGPQAPYLQSERLDIYKRWAQKLIDKGLAYSDPYTPEEVEVFRQQAIEGKRPFLFRNHRPVNASAWDGTKPLRFKIPSIKRYDWLDLVRGPLSAGDDALDDFILIKSDGYPTYNFAHIIDDIEMSVTHVVRGEEFISSTPNYLALYEALELSPPQFATMPVILGPDGNKKLSKRDAAKDVFEYRAEGYLPEALVNFLAFLGWNPGDEREVMSLAELTEAFGFEHVHKSGAKFDETKLRWFNHEHIKRLPPTAFTERIRAYMSAQKMEIPSYLDEIAVMLQERSYTLRDAAEALVEGEYSFLSEDVSASSDLLLKGAEADAATVKQHLENVLSLLQPVSDEDFTTENIKTTVFPYATEVGRSSVLWPMRVSLSGKEKSPDPFTLAHLLQKKKTLARIAHAISVL